MGSKFAHIAPLTDEEEAQIQKQIASDPDSPELTDEEIARAKPFAEAFPHLSESIKRSRGRPATGNAKQVVSIRLEAEVVAKLKATGPNWHRLVNDILKAAKV